MPEHTTIEGTSARATIVEALRSVIADEMDRDDDIYVIGEDISQGGAFQASVGLLDRFGAGRVVDAPISEAAIVGLAIGSAMRGLHPIVDFQYGDFLYAAADQLIQQATKLRYMSGGQVAVPMLIHLPTGASGRGAQHANCLEASFFGVPGLRVVTPTTPSDTAGLMRTALRDPNLVLFCIHKSLYGTEGRDNLYPETSTGAFDTDEAIPYGSARIAREGSDVTIVANLLMLHRSLAVAGQAAADGISVEVIDPRTIVPFDIDTVETSVSRTGRLITVEESPRRAGWGGYLIGELARRGVLEGAAVERIAAPDLPVPFAPNLEQAVIPSEAQIREAVDRVMAGTASATASTVQAGA
jgi:pyruvate dehydrogenase E1 component beta subunit